MPPLRDVLTKGLPPGYVPVENTPTPPAVSDNNQAQFSSPNARCPLPPTTADAVATISRPCGGCYRARNTTLSPFLGVQTGSDEETGYQSPVNRHFRHSRLLILKGVLYTFSGYAWYESFRGRTPIYGQRLFRPRAST